MLELDAGRGVTLFDGRPLHRHPQPARQAGALLGDVPGHPARTVRGHLRMLAAAAGVPAARAEEVLEAVGLTGMAGSRLGSLSLGMDRRLGLAAALLAEPAALLLDDPTRDLTPRDTDWLHGLLRARAARGGTVIVTGRDPKGLARIADRVITLNEGRLVADQPVAEFGRTRLRPYVAVRSPHAQRLAGLLTDEGAEVVSGIGSGSRIAVYGTTPAQVGETAFRHGILLHRLADATADSGPPPAPWPAATGRGRPGRHLRRPARPGRGAPARPGPAPALRTAPAHRRTRPLADRRRVADRLAAGHPRPAGYRSPRVPAAGHRLAAAAAVASRGVVCRTARGARLRPGVPLSRPHPRPWGGPRQLRLLAAKLTVNGAVALLLTVLAAGLGSAAERLAGGPGDLPAQADRPALLAGWAALSVGCAWAGVLAAGVFRTTALGMAGVLAVPLLVAPALRKAARHRASTPYGWPRNRSGTPSGWRSWSCCAPIW